MLCPALMLGYLLSMCLVLPGAHHVECESSLPRLPPGLAPARSSINLETSMAFNPSVTVDDFSLHQQVLARMLPSDCRAAAHFRRLPYR